MLEEPNITDFVRVQSTCKLPSSETDGCKGLHFSFFHEMNQSSGRTISPPRRSTDITHLHLLPLTQDDLHWHPSRPDITRRWTTLNLHPPLYEISFCNSAQGLPFFFVLEARVGDISGPWLWPLLDTLIPFRPSDVDGDGNYLADHSAWGGSFGACFTRAWLCWSELAIWRARSSCRRTQAGAILLPVKLSVAERALSPPGLSVSEEPGLGPFRIPARARATGIEAHHQWQFGRAPTAARTSDAGFT